MSDLIREMRELVKELNLASRAYYQESREIMTNYEYDKPVSYTHLRAHET